MAVGAYYNENDPFAAAWLRELIKHNLIAPGDVDDRSIADVSADELAGYAQHHFFAGIGGWSYALRLAGWPDDKPVWTGSCPCQPFSAAGAQKGFADARHLWPEWFRLIRESRPHVVFGEQVASAGQWLDLVSGDLEGEGYAIGAAVLGAHSVGAPHIRQRFYWVAESSSERRQQERRSSSRYEETNGSARRDGGESYGDYVVSSDGEIGIGLGESTEGRRGQGQTGEAVSRGESCGAVERPVDAGELAQPNGGNSIDSRVQRSGIDGLRAQGGRADGDTRDGERPQDRLELSLLDGRLEGRSSPSERGVERGRREGGMEQPTLEQAGLPGRAWESRSAESMGLPVSTGLQIGIGDGQVQPDSLEPSSREASLRRGDTFWSACDWLPCIDSKSRPVEPGTFPLAHGIPRRVGKLRGYGNAIVPQVAAEFIEAYLAS